MEPRATTAPPDVCQPDVIFRFPDGHTWAYAGSERVWMHEVPIGAEWADCRECDELMDKLGEPPMSQIPLTVVSKSKTK